MRHSKCAPSLPVTYHPSPRSLTCSPLTYQLSPRSGASGYQNRVHKKHGYLITCPQYAILGLFIRPLDHLGQHRAQPPLSPVRLSPLSCSRAAASPFSCYLAPPLSPSPVHLSPHSCSRAARHFAKSERAYFGNLAICPWCNPNAAFIGQTRNHLAIWQTAHPTQIRSLLSDPLPAANESSLLDFFALLPSCPLDPSLP